MLAARGRRIPFAACTRTGHGDGGARAAPASRALRGNAGARWCRQQSSSRPAAALRAGHGAAERAAARGDKVCLQNLDIKLTAPNRALRAIRSQIGATPRELLRVPPGVAASCYNATADTAALVPDGRGRSQHVRAPARWARRDARAALSSAARRSPCPASAAPGPPAPPSPRASQASST